MTAFAVTGRNAALQADAIRGLLPHRPPFLLLDRVIALDEGRSARGIRNVGVAEPWFAGHFPDSYVYPGVLVIESLAQLAGVVLAAGSREGDGARIGYLAAVRSLKFSRPVRPGDQVVLDAEAGPSLNGITDFTVSAHVDGELVAAGRIAIATAGPDEERR